MIRFLPNTQHSKTTPCWLWNLNVFSISLFIGVFSLSASGKTFVVSGKVTASEDGSPLHGVTVLLKESSSGTSTNSDGAFRLETSKSNRTLVFSFVGYATQGIPIDSRTTVDVVMMTDRGQRITLGHK